MTTPEAGYKLLDPARALSSPDLTPYYVARPGDPMATLAEEIRLAESPLRVLIVGQRGVGKSTEILRLTRALEADEQRKVIFLSLTNIAGVSLDEDHSRFLFESILADLDEEVADTLSDIEVIQRVQEIAVRTSPPIIVLVDGIERLTKRGAAALFRPVLSTDNVSFITTCPIDLAIDPDYARDLSEFDRRIVLTALMDGEVHDASTMRKIIKKRVGATLFSRDALSTILEASGGVFRDLLSVGQQCCARASLRGASTVQEAMARAVVAQRQLDMTFSISPADIDYLATISLDERITYDPRAVTLIHRGAIVVYDDRWTIFRVHPLVRDLVAKHQARRSA